MTGATRLLWTGSLCLAHGNGNLVAEQRRLVAEGLVGGSDGVVVAGERHAVKWGQHSVSDYLVMRPADASGKNCGLAGW